MVAVSIYRINFTKIFHSLLKSDQLLEATFKSAIVFITDEENVIRHVYESKPLSQEMSQFYHKLEKNIRDGKGTEDDQFHFIVGDLNIHTDLTQSQVTVGIITKKSDYSQSEMNAFLHPFIQLCKQAVDLQKEERKSAHYSKLHTVQDKVAKLLIDTNYGHNLSVLAKQLLNQLKGNYSADGDIVFLIKSHSRQLFIPVQSTNDSIMKIKEKYTVQESTFENLYMSLSEMGLSQVSKNVAPKHLFENQTNYEDFSMFPLIYDSENIGLILFLDNNSNCHLHSIKEIRELLVAISPWIKRLIENEEMVIEKTRKELLLKVTGKFHSSMDVSDILEEILNALLGAYPTFEVDLLLSHDWDVSDHLPVQPLDFQSYAENDLAAQAYLTGQIQTEDFIHERRTILYVPLKGKQGVYGVFKMKAANTLVFENEELEFIQVLADTGGNAIENAELYQQSQQHITNLKLINKISQELNENLNVSEMIQFMMDEVRNNFSIDELGVLIFTERWLEYDEIMKGSGAYFNTEEGKKELAAIIQQIKEQKEGIFLGKCDDESVYHSSQYQSVMAIPMVHNMEIVGIAIALGKEPYMFSFDIYKLFLSIVQHSTLVFVNAMLHEELEQLLITDYLTKLYTRKYLDDKVVESLGHDRFGAFLLIDIDKFKKINDEYGHQVGDKVIVQVSQVIIERVKREDGLAARWGGEELAVYLRETSKSEAIQIAEEIRKTIEETCDYNVTVSCGVSIWSKEVGHASLKSLFHLADKAMYRAKSQGRNQVVFLNE